VTDLFLSYKAEDRSRILPLVKALEEDGFSVWWDAHIGGGEDWRQTILRHLEAAKCVLVVWSRRSVGPEGEFVRDEATRAKKLGSYLPVRIDKVDPPLGFGETQALDLRNWKGDRTHSGYQALLGALRGRVGDGSAEVAATPARGVSRRTAIVGGTAVAAVGAASGAWLFLRPARTSAESIAVLPFANLSGDPNQAYFSDGIAEELRSALAKIPDLSVVARTSSEALRNADAQTAASKLHVQNILTGSVRHSGSMLRVSAQLIDGSKGTERWSEVYDRPFGDALQIQGQIATMVAQALSIHLGADERQALKEGGTSNSEAQDLLLQAQAIAWRRDDEPSVRRAMDLVDRALSLDPKYGEALTAKAAILTYLSGFLGTSAAKAQLDGERAEKIAREAVRVAPRSAQARAALGDILWTQLRLRSGMAEFDAMKKLPGAASSFFSGLDPYALALAQSLRSDESLARTERLIATDPLNPYAYSSKALCLGAADRFEEAEQVVRQAVVLGPDLIWARASHAFFLMESGRAHEADKEFTALEGTGPWLAWAAVAALRNGRPEDADRLVSVMQKSMGDAAYFQYAQVFAQQGRIDDAIAALEAGWRKRDSGLAFLQIDRMLDPLRKDARFQAIMKRLDFPT
jgi:serine/threonine-protein kinase